ncbi:MAG: superoxide dismutase [Bryobacterales bacterium]|nr:superoxide dismutase [Bryobacteraceae bacterium]MDW8131576.1 superoxide dismutase [Bryobacterales bacterium]
MPTRRDLLRTFSVPVLSGLAPAAASAQQTEPFGLPPLPYPYDALEPHIDAKTMQIHHTGHHGAYVRNLNAAIAKYPELARKSIEELLSDLNALPADVRTTIRNNGGGHANHTLFWQIMSPKGGGQPSGELAKAIEKAFGSFARFQEQFIATAMGVFGSGWAWLSLDRNKQLRIEPTPNQDTPIMEGRTPILGIDVWEHAYYLKYQNRRIEYVKAFQNVIAWEKVAELYQAALRRLSSV